MKFLKGCLIILLIFITVCVIGWFSFEKNVEKNLAEMNQKVEQNWVEYTANLKERNKQLSKQKTENDSIEYYLKSSSNIINSKDYAMELELNEYKFNKILMANSVKSNLNDKLNSNLNNYNKAVREYNVYRVRFPNSIIARRMNFRKSFKYFDIRYGIDNEKVIARKKKVENWVKNGGAYPE